MFKGFVMRKTIRYAFDLETGLTVSRVGDEVAFYELDYPFTKNPMCHLTKLSSAEVCSVADWLDGLVWTRKMEISDKNEHRKFWNMKLLEG